ncbi:MAG TPA: beta-1,6-N-acetylglucosaminyltransferase [Longimicrobiales bacterium]|nr:beta-1,6-N-acetylglucosaminyltransferase [Longimicrobiales bacterium]
MSIAYLVLAHEQPAELEPYGGSQWWSRTHDCVEYTLSFVEENPDFVRFYRFTECPDEMFFQTVMNSLLASRAANYQLYREWSGSTPEGEKTDQSRIPEDTFNLRYIAWTGPYGGERGYPSILDERDFCRLRDSHCLLARKFDPQKSAKLMAQIDAQLLNEAPAPGDVGR